MRWEGQRESQNIEDRRCGGGQCDTFAAEQ